MMFDRDSDDFHPVDVFTPGEIWISLANQVDMHSLFHEGGSGAARARIRRIRRKDHHPDPLAPEPRAVRGGRFCQCCSSWHGAGRREILESGVHAVSGYTVTFSLLVRKGPVASAFLFWRSRSTFIWFDA